MSMQRRRTWLLRKNEAIWSRKVGQRKNFVDIWYFLSFKLSLVRISEEERTTHREFEAHSDVAAK